jgi:hypothetical protein
MNIHLHIERVIVNGVPDGLNRTDIVQKAVETERARLVHEQGLPFSTSGMRPHASGGSIHPTRDTNASGLGRQIAQGIYHGIRNGNE